MTTPSRDSKTISMRDKQRMDALFTALAQTFFEKFTGRFPNVETLEIAKKIWAGKLQAISDRQIKYALDVCCKWTQDFAPTLPQFIDLCYQAPRDFTNDLTLKHIPVCDVKTAEKNIEKLREILGMKPKYSQGNK